MEITKEIRKFLGKEARYNINHHGINPDQLPLLIIQDSSNNNLCRLFRRRACNLIKTCDFFLTEVVGLIASGIASNICLDAAGMHRGEVDRSPSQFLLKGLVQGLHCVLRTRIGAVHGSPDKAVDT